MEIGLEVGLMGCCHSTAQPMLLLGVNTEEERDEEDMCGERRLLTTVCCVVSRRRERCDDAMRCAALRRAYVPIFFYLFFFLLLLSQQGWLYAVATATMHLTGGGKGKREDCWTNDNETREKGSRTQAKGTKRSEATTVRIKLGRGGAWVDGFFCLFFLPLVRLDRKTGDGAGSATVHCV